MLKTLILFIVLISLRAQAGEGTMKVSRDIPLPADRGATSILNYGSAGMPVDGIKCVLRFTSVAELRKLRKDEIFTYNQLPDAPLQGIMTVDEIIAYVESGERGASLPNMSIFRAVVRERLLGTLRAYDVPFDDTYYFKTNIFLHADGALKARIFCSSPEFFTIEEILTLLTRIGSIKPN